VRILLSGGQYYKNHRCALRAIAILKASLDRAVQIVKLGPMSKELTVLAEQLGLAEGCLVLEGIRRSELPDVYNSVDVLLFPSMHEGFGWPPLEAMACGVPVVASNRGSIPEVVGDAAFVADARPEALADSTRCLLTDDVIRAKLVTAGLGRARLFRWDKAAKQMMAVYETVLREWRGALTACCDEKVR
jgi:glycosyltransferase involved in cell wall biosynthesis